MWRIGGHVLIERIGARLGEFLHYPFEMISQGQQRPSVQQVQQFARQAGEAFLSILDDSDRARRGLFGDIAGVNIVFSTFHF